jgi:hypothetical protein
LKIKEKAMYAIIAMGEEPYCIEIPCMVFMTKQADAGYLFKNTLAATLRRTR